MATDVDQAYFAWPQDELSDQNDSQGISVSQMLDHGSISFGRFEFESLSWEKWSVFTHDRRQEELEKFNGLVAQKKAYFEEYYRKLRALKALRQQQNQQTELTLDYSGDGSISSQTGEDDEIASQLESLRDGTANNTDAAGEATVASTLEQEINFSENPKVGNFDPECSSHPASSKGRLEKIEEERKIQPFVKESIMKFGTFEGFTENGSSSLNNKEISMVPQYPQSDLEHRAAPHQTIVEPTNSQDRDSKLRLPRKSIPENARLPRKKPLDQPVTKKESAPSTRLGLNSRQKTKPDMIQSSERTKQTLQKTIVRADGSSHRTKEAAARVTSTNRSTSVVSHRPLKEIRPNVTTPRPFSATRERRAAVRESTVKIDSRASKREVLPPNYAKGGPSWQGTPKKLAIPSSTVKSSRTETKRDFKKALKEPLAMESQCTSSRSTEAHLLGTPKSRSINFPPRKMSSSSCRTELQFMETFGRNKNKEGNKETKLTQALGVTTKTVIPSRPGSSTGSQKPLPPKTSDPSCIGSKRQVNKLSLNGRKLK